MISIKGGTQTFSPSQQQSSLKGSGDQQLSASEREKYFDGKDLGQVLNQVADPNWVDPTKIQRKVGGNELDKEAFLKLLLTQLKNQDPTSPMESHQMAAQLAQFSSLEQLSNINSSIEGLAKSQKPSQQFEALKMIGKAVQGDSSKIFRSDLTQKHELTFTLPQDVTQVDLAVKDELGNVVREFTAHNLKQGKNTIDWDGVIDNGSKARPGNYSLDIQARDGAGKKIHAETKFKGVVTGVNFSPLGPVLMLGSQSVKMSEVKSIIDPQTIKDQAAPAHEVKNVKVKEKKDDQSDSSQAASNMEAVGMDRGLLNKMKKQGINAGL